MRSAREATRRQRVLGSALLVALLALTGCNVAVYNSFQGNAGTPLPDTSRLEIGVTTKGEALELLGPPLSIRRQFDGDLFLWVYRGTESSGWLLIPYVPVYDRTRGRSGTDRLALLFDHDGILSGVGARKEAP